MRTIPCIYPGTSKYYDMFFSYSIHLEHYTYWLTEQSSELSLSCKVFCLSVCNIICRTKTVMYLTSKLSCSRHNTWCTRIEPATSGLTLSRLIQQTTNSLIFFFFYFPENRKTGFVIPCYVDNLHEMPNLFPWKNEKNVICWKFYR